MPQSSTRSQKLVTRNWKAESVRADYPSTFSAIALLCIDELEALLLEKEMQSSNSTAPVNQPASQFLDSDMDILARALSHSPSFDNFISPAVVTSTPGSSPRSSTGLEILWHNYPPGLPNPDLLRHLVEVFFVFHPHANRVLHYPSFMASLTLSPSHPKFPAIPILHAICAIGSLYTAAVTSPPLPNFSEVALDEIFHARHRIREGRPDSFAEQQAKYARDTADQCESVGDRLFEIIQGKLTVWAYVHSFNTVHSSYHSYVVLLVSFPVCLFWSGFDILTCHGTTDGSR